MNIQISTNDHKTNLLWDTAQQAADYHHIELNKLQGPA
jgi:hypothetical protein